MRLKVGTALPSSEELASLARPLLRTVMCASPFRSSCLSFLPLVS